jgi:hypothetical protein
MIMRTGRTLWGSLLTVAVLAACDQRNPVEPGIAEVPSTSEAARSPAPLQVYPHEAEFYRLSQEIDGYGGHFFDEQGNLVVHLIDPAQEGQARQFLEPLFDTRVLSAREATLATRGTIVVRPADFTFPQLALWRDQATDEVLGKEGVELIDLDEVQNRVIIGVSTPRARMEAVQTLSRHAIPADAILYVDAEPAVFDQSLQQHFRPLRGGFQIQNDYGGDCTLGFNAIRNGQPVFLTNSHCTRIIWGPDMTIFYQPSISNANLIGFEILDPAPFGCGFLNLSKCRRSDAAIVQRFGGVTGDFGYIARTTGWAFGLGKSGSLTVDLNNPRMRIEGELPQPRVGQVLDKIGRTTGWTYGIVDQTCVNLATQRGIILCQDFTREMHSGQGDSGSPMFVWGGSTVRLAGLHWGRASPGGRSVAIMSSMANIRADLGAFSTH